MKIHTLVGLAMLASLANLGCAYGAQSVREILEPLRDVIKSEQQVLKNDGSNERDVNKSYQMTAFLERLAQLDGDDPNHAHVVRMIEQVMNSDVSPKVTEACASILPVLRTHVAELEKTQREQFESTLRSAFAQGIQATTAKDLDEPLASLEKLGKKPWNGSQIEDGRLNPNDLSAATSVLTAIQDALISLESPAVVSDSMRRNGRDPQSKLANSMSSYGRQVSNLIPRSELLKKTQALSDRLSALAPEPALTRSQFDQEVSNLTSAVKTLEDVGPALTKLSELAQRQQDAGGTTGNPDLGNQVQTFQRALQDVQRGEAVSLRSASTLFARNGLEKIGSQITKATLSRVFGHLPNLGAAGEESVSAYLQRALGAAIQSSDWQAVSKVIDAAQTLNLSSVLNSSDTAALKLFLAGVNYQTARRYDAAVISYLSCLKSGSQAVPSARVGDLLDELKKDHPAQYEAGVQQARDVETQEKSGRIGLLDSRMGIPTSPARMGRPGQMPARGPNPPEESDMVAPFSVPQLTPPPRGAGPLFDPSKKE